MSVLPTQNILDNIISPKIVGDPIHGYSVKTDIVNIDNLIVNTINGQVPSTNWNGNATSNLVMSAYDILTNGNISIGASGLLQGLPVAPSTIKPPVKLGSDLNMNGKKLYDLSGSLQIGNDTSGTVVINTTNTGDIFIGNNDNNITTIGKTLITDTIGGNTSLKLSSPLDLNAFEIVNTAGTAVKFGSNVDMHGHTLLDSISTGGVTVGSNLNMNSYLLKDSSGNGVRLGSNLNMNGSQLLDTSSTGAPVTLGSNLNTNGKLLLDTSGGTGVKMGADLDMKDNLLKTSATSGSMNLGVKLGSDLDMNTKLLRDRSSAGAAVTMGSSLDMNGQTLVDNSSLSVMMGSNLDMNDNLLVNNSSLTASVKMGSKIDMNGKTLADSTGNLTLGSNINMNGNSIFDSSPNATVNFGGSIRAQYFINAGNTITVGSTSLDQYQGITTPYLNVGLDTTVNNLTINNSTLFGSNQSGTIQFSDDGPYDYYTVFNSSIVQNSMILFSSPKYTNDTQSEISISSIQNSIISLEVPPPSDGQRLTVERTIDALIPIGMYYVLNPNRDTKTFQLSLYPGGPAVTLTNYNGPNTGGLLVKSVNVEPVPFTYDVIPGIGFTIYPVTAQLPGLMILDWFIINRVIGGE